MKKGFTLVEMLGIIIILSILSLITYNGIVTMNQKASQREFEDYKKTLYMATETYLKVNDIDATTEQIIDINTLLSGNYIDKVVENPSTKQQEYNAKIKVKKDGTGALVYEYVNE